VILDDPLVEVLVPGTNTFKFGERHAVVLLSREPLEATSLLFTKPAGEPWPLAIIGGSAEFWQESSRSAKFVVATFTLPPGETALEIASESFGVGKVIETFRWLLETAPDPRDVKVEAKPKGTGKRCRCTFDARSPEGTVTQAIENVGCCDGIEITAGQCNVRCQTRADVAAPATRRPPGRAQLGPRRRDRLDAQTEPVLAAARLLFDRTGSAMVRSQSLDAEGAP
jgi:hypothetical protein